MEAKKTEEKAPVKVGFFKRTLLRYKAKKKAKAYERDAEKLLELSKAFGYALVRIVKRGNTDYIVSRNGEYRRIGRPER